jgi:hypothetical protein
VTSTRDRRGNPGPHIGHTLSQAGESHSLQI